MRIDKIITNRKKPDKPVMTSLGELYEWQKTPEGKAELDKFYPSKDEAEKMMQDYRADLKARGILPSINRKMICD